MSTACANGVKLVTSVAPHNIESQRRAIDSWLHAGFSVTSLNIEPEIAQCRGAFPDIDFQPVVRDARPECGRPLVYLDDIFAFLKRHGSDVCGLINSDIHLRADEAKVRYVVDQARGSLVLACRTDVESLDNRIGEVYKHGYDVFLFDRAILDLVPSSKFCLGQPWWDYWFPSRFFRPPRPIPLKLVTFPFAAHVKHSSNWNRDRNFEKYGLYCMQFSEPDKARALANQPSEQLRLSIGLYSVQIARTIWQRCQWLSYAADTC